MEFVLAVMTVSLLAAGYHLVTVRVKARVQNKKDALSRRL